MARFRNLLLLSALFGWFGLAGCDTAGGKLAEAGFPEKVVYHVNDSAVAGAALVNVQNHLDINPQATIVMVTHGRGIDFLLEGAADKDGNPYDIKVQELKARGVTFDVCNITLDRRKIDPKKVIPEAVIVPSGVAEVSKLQSQQGYVYLKP